MRAPHGTHRSSPDRSKVIKKTAKILTIVAVTLTFLLATPVILLNNNKIQNYVVSRLTEWLSGELGTRIGIGHVNIRLPNRLGLERLYIEDLNGDTLIYADDLYAHLRIRPLLKEGRFIVSAIRLHGFFANLLTDTAGNSNMDFIISYLNIQPDPDMRLQLQIERISLAQGRIAYRDMRTEKGAAGTFSPGDIRLYDIGAELDIDMVTGRFLRGDIGQLTFRERSGFSLDGLSTRFFLSDTLIALSGLTVSTPRSRLAAESAYLHPDTAAAKGERLWGADCNLKITEGNLYLPDFKAFVPQLGNLREKLTVGGSVHGRIDNIKAERIKLRYGDHLSFECSLQASGLPDIEQTFFYGNIRRLSFNKGSVQDLISNITGQPIVLPAEIDRLGNCTYKGNISGFLGNLVLFGNLLTDIGSVNTDVSIQTDKDFSKFSVEGKIKTSRLALGKLLPASGLGDASFSITTSLLAGKHTEFHSISSIDIDHISYNRYRYRDINIAGEISKNNFSGDISLDDRNGSLHFNGSVMIDEDYKYCHFTAAADSIRFHDLHLTEEYPELELSLKMNAAFEGEKWDNLNGSLKIDSILIENHGETYAIDSLHVYSRNNGNNRVEIRSDIINGEMQGIYTVSSLKNSFLKIVSRQMPIIREKIDIKAPHHDNVFFYHVDIAPTDRLMHILDIPWSTTRESTIQGQYDDLNNTFVGRIYVPQLSNGTTDINGISLTVDNREKISLSFLAETKMKEDSLYAGLSINALNDTVTASISIDNRRDSNMLNGEIITRTALSYTPSGKLQMNTVVLPSELIIKDKPWHIERSEIVSDLTYFDIRKLMIQSADQMIAINGTASDSKEDSISVELKKISLDYISGLLPEETLRSLHFGGEVSGQASVKDLFGTPQLTADVYGDRFMFNKSYLGWLHATSYFDNSLGSLVFSGTVIPEGGQDTSAVILGNYFFAKDSLDIIGKAKGLDLRFLNYYLAGILDDVRGKGTGDVHIYGITKSKNIAVETTAFVEDGEVGIDFLQTKYLFSDTIKVTKDLISFNDISLTDTEGNHGTLNGLIRHSYFRDMNYNIGITADNMLVLDTDNDKSESFYGRAYATGDVNIYGNEQGTNINCKVTTNRNTRVVIPIDQYSAADNSFITFISPYEDEDEEIVSVKGPQPDLMLDLMLDVTPEAEIQLNINSKSGDMIRATGGGSIRITYDVNSSDLKMYGTYNIEQGMYLFNFQNAIRKYFNVQEGSSLSWAGDPLSANININAYYQLTASLSDLMQPEELVNVSRTSVPVQCILNLTGSLTQPNIKFDLNLPNSDEELNRLLKNKVNTTEQMNRQIISLLILGKFIDQESNDATSVINQNELYSVVSSTLSSQLNDWASQMFTNWNFGLNFRTTGEGEDRTNEYEFNFLYTPNDRIVLNGNVGYRDDVLSDSKFIGDFDFEYKLVRSGKLSAKAYTHTNDYREFKKSLTTQGIGLVFRESFNSLPELWQEWKQQYERGKINREKRKIEREKIKADRKEKKLVKKEERKKAREIKREKDKNK